MQAPEYDVVVIGAGPAGSRTAAQVAREGYRVLLLEKRGRVGFPVRCAEAVGPRDCIERFIELDPQVISSPVNGICIIAPDGRKFEKLMPNVGFILDRELFDRRLADAALANGAELRTGHQATGLVTKNGIIRGVEVTELQSGRTYRATAAVVVGADGIEALSPRWAGLKKSLNPGEIFACAQELIDGIPDGDELIEFHLGARFAPGGYAWVFPKGKDKANVGVGINPLKAGGRTAVSYLDAFIEHRCPEGRRMRLVIGGCCVARGIPALASDGFLTVGEAAHQNNPFSGGGIANALEGADMAAESILGALEVGDTSNKALSSYTRRWNKSVGRTNNEFYRVAQIFYNLSDEELSRIAAKIARIPGLMDEKGVRPVRLLMAIIAAQPKLLLTLTRSLAARLFRP